MDDYYEVYSLWQKTEGLKLDESDSYENMNNYLKRNPKLNYVAVHDKRIIGTVKSRQDGRRGYIYHLVVDEKYRKNNSLNIYMRSV